jgi:hypothetical protein
MLKHRDCRKIYVDTVDTVDAVQTVADIDNCNYLLTELNIKRQNEC